MPISLSGRNYLKLLDFTPDEIRYLISLAKQFKALKLAGTPHKYLEGKNIVLLFEKTSTRTRCSFEVAGHDLGLGVTYLDPGSSQMGKKESIEDTARVLGRMFDGIEYRGYGQEIVENLAAHAGVPVWNGLTNEFHPTQMIADMLTLEENFPEGIKGKKLVFMGEMCIRDRHSKGRRRRAEGIPLPYGEAPLNAGSHSRLPAPFLGLWRECVRGTKGNRSASPQVVRRKRPLRRPFSGKRREIPLTAGGGARNISPCAADGRKRRGGALDAPGTLKTGYRGKRIGTRAGPPPA